MKRLLVALLMLWASVAQARDSYVLPQMRPDNRHGDIDGARITCVSSVTDLTTYNEAPFQAISTGFSDTDYLSVYVGIISRDSAITFNVTGVTVNGYTANEIVDSAGAFLVSAAFYYVPHMISNAASLNVSVTHSEAVTSATICIWVKKYQKTVGVFASDQDGSTNEANMGSTIGVAPNGATVMCVTAANTTGQAASMGGGPAERQETCDAEKCYGVYDDGADGVINYTPNSDWGAGTDDSQQACIASTN